MEVLGGKGGGNPSIAQGGAVDSTKLDLALAKAPEIFAGLLHLQEKG